MGESHRRLPLQLVVLTFVQVPTNLLMRLTLVRLIGDHLVPLLALVPKGAPTEEASLVHFCRSCRCSRSRRCCRNLRCRWCFRCHGAGKYLDASDVDAAASWSNGYERTCQDCLAWGWCPRGGATRSNGVTDHSLSAMASPNVLFSAMASLTFGRGDVIGNDRFVFAMASQGCLTAFLGDSIAGRFLPGNGIADIFLGDGIADGSSCRCHRQRPPFLAMASPTTVFLRWHRVAKTRKGAPLIGPCQSTTQRKQPKQGNPSFEERKFRRRTSETLSEHDYDRTAAAVICWRLGLGASPAVGDKRGNGTPNAA